KRGHAPVASNHADRGVMRDYAFLRPVNESKTFRDAFDFLLGPSKEMPATLGAPKHRIARKHFRRIVSRIECDTKQDQIRPLRKSPLNTREARCQPRANIRQGATCIEELRNHYLALETAQAHTIPMLIRQCEIGHRMSHRDLFDRGS